MTKKINVGIVFGGKSGEYDVSLLSAYNVIKGINKDKYDLTLLGISIDGRIYHYTGDIENIPNNKWINDSEHLNKDFSILNSEIINNIDIIFPVLHGQNCEDGKIQGLFEVMDKPYVGCEVLGSAVCMDKDIAKRIFRSVSVPVVKDVCLFDTDIIDEKNLLNNIKKCEKELGYPVFVKPVNMGSSVGISKAHSNEELKEALLYAVKFDTKILVEQGINARELEVGVLGNSNPKSTYPGEIIACKEFYDYEAKYLSGDGSKIEIPATLDKDKQNTIMNYAIKAFRACGCFGLARVDFFENKENGDIYLNEINTLPGFTNISMYAKLWDNMGIPYDKLIDELITLGFERYSIKHKLTIKE